MSTRALSVVRSISSFEPSRGIPSVVTIGNFDGVHLGHQDILRRLTSIGASESARSVAVSFYPHPSIVLGRAKYISVISPLHQKVQLFDEQGVTTLFLLHFTKALAGLTAAEFLERYVIRTLGATHVLLGPDTALGKDRKGTKEFISEFLNDRGVKTTTSPFLEIQGSRVSSKRIREAITSGEVATAATLLGRPYELFGRVLHGYERGRTIGVPTANIMPYGQVVPKLGVYASYVVIDGAAYAAVTNVGVKPTFGVHSTAVESHIFSFDRDVYGKRISVRLIAWIREEQKFADIQSLKDQLSLDIVAAKTIHKASGIL